ncbi:MAG: hypothetical protein AAB686_00065, partial [Patescibacteria group bacterium]
SERSIDIIPLARGLVAAVAERAGLLVRRQTDQSAAFAERTTLFRPLPERLPHGLADGRHHVAKYMREHRHPLSVCRLADIFSVAKHIFAC